MSYPRYYVTFNFGELSDLHNALLAGCERKLGIIKLEIRCGGETAPDMVRYLAADLVRFSRFLDRVEATLYDKPQSLAREEGTA
jgi:hypothetical protein